MAENTIKTSHAPVRRDEGSIPATRERVRYVTPAVDIYETDDSLVVVADMPGVKKDDLEISVENNLLTIHARPGVAMDESALMREFSLGEYFRQFTLGDKVDRDRITASLDQGVLTLSLPRAEEAKPRLIKVKAK